MDIVDTIMTAGAAAAEASAYLNAQNGRVAAPIIEERSVVHA
jgi:orotate phosphoribosyltransferase